ncbi:MAG: aryl-sulfate sulfotransferase [Hyphomicrobiales bacterium]|nr:MAG: aryl-sulfate sulfotransferase [Hyphomicrobiales bacterium]
MQKRSLTINGHRTSLALEPLFWDALTEMADRRGLSLPALIADIDSLEPHANLASAIRCAVLSHYRDMEND